MTSIVIDTNIFVAAGFNPNSYSATIIERVRQGTFNLAWSTATRRETCAVIEKIPPLNWQDFDDLFMEAHRVTEQIYPEDFSAIPDPDDRKFAALAAKAGATLITNDDHLLAVREQFDVWIDTPGEFLDYIQQR
jgi:predicted nucleic acid-binding protein